jgi:rhodanese-related sulfurtransferase
VSERVLTITPERLSGLMRIGEGGVLVDVRSPAEYRAGHVPGATLLPLDELDVDRVVARTGTTEIGAALTLQRQAQIAVGLLIVLKVIFGYTLHELFFAAAALFGAGLVVAGVTRWCGMERLMGMMPWNRAGKCPDDLPSASG